MNRRNFLLSSVLSALHTRVSFPFRGRKSQATSDARSVKEKLRSDPLRPQFHLLPEAGFLGDPCAARFYKGQYHAFFHGSFGGRGWQHAVSPDLVHWRHMPIALSPTEGSYDSYGTFTGSVLPSDEGAAIVYTGTTKVSAQQETIRHEGIREVQCIATTLDPDLKTWHKLTDPVIAQPPHGLKVTGFRDPFSWREDGIWYMGVGSGVSRVGGLVLLYRSRDARNWEYLHPLAQGTWNGETFSNPVPSGEMWECPDFFALGNKHVLLYSTEGKAFWEVGTFDRIELRFHAEGSGLLDHGAYYAPKSMLDPNGRRILWAWVQETRSREDTISAGWAGCMSLPRVLSLSEAGDLEMQVAPEFYDLLRNTVEITGKQDLQTLAGALGRISIPGRAGHITFTFEVGDKPFGLHLYLGGGQEKTAMLNLSYGGNVHGFSAIKVNDVFISLSPDSTSTSTIEVWIDGSVLEVFGDQRSAVTLRTYPVPTIPGHIGVQWSGNPEAFVRLAASEVSPISPQRLPS